MKRALFAALLLVPVSAFGAGKLPATVQPSPDPNPNDPKLTYDYCTIGERTIPCRCRPGCPNKL